MISESATELHPRPELSQVPLIHKEEFTSAKLSETQAVVRAIGNLGSPDSVNVGMDDLYKPLTISADQVLKKLEEALAEDLPEGIASLDPKDHTPEKTADRIVSGVLAFASIYAQQNPGLEGDELVSSFMDTIRGGIKQGYEEAMEILEGAGALGLDGIADGIAETMRLVEEKLSAYEDSRKSKPAESRATLDQSEVQEAGFSVEKALSN